VIDGITVSPLQQITGEKGKVMHMLSTKSPAYSKFGEVYFSITHPGAVKAWYQHKEMVLNFAAISGEIKVVLYDERPSSLTCGQIDEIFISPENYMLVTVPPKIWYGFKALGPETAILANCASIPHDPLEIVRLSPTDSSIPYSWESNYFEQANKPEIS
jgi:dTDP-4-dehydrorhamnose 3,5-epimerase